MIATLYDRARRIELRPLLVAVAFALGVHIAPEGGADLRAVWAAAGVALLGAAGLRRAPWLAALGIAALGIARGMVLPATILAGATADDRTVDRVVGTVRGPVVATASGMGARVEPEPRPSGSSDDSTVFVWFDEPVAPGTRVAVAGYLRRPRGWLGPGQSDRDAALQARDARFELTARSVTRLGDDPGLVDRTWRWASAMQARWSRAIDAAGGDAGARAALRGIAVGDRAAVPPALDDRWRAAGIFHVLSVSGLHLAVIAGLAFLVLRRLVAASPLGGRRHPARLAAPLALAIAIAYTLVTGAQVATLRALVVIALVVVAAALDRPLRLLDALGGAALAILVWRPAQLADPGFQLSFVAALALAIAPRAGVDLEVASRARRVARWATRGFAASLRVAIATAPITALHFHQVSAGGVLGNLVLAPALELVAMPLALAGLIVHWWLPIRIATTAVMLVDRATALLGPVTPVGHVALAGPRVALALVVLSLAITARPARARLDVVAWLALCLGWALGRSPPPDDALRVTFLDVGQGDAAIVELPGGGVWLVDAGGAPNAGSLAAATATGIAVRRTLAVYGHDHVDLAIISHPHPDHYLGLLALGVPVHELWCAEEDPAPERDPDVAARRPGGLPGFARVLSALAAGGTHVAHPPLGLARTAGGVELVVWAPRLAASAGAPEVEHVDPVRTVNDNSLVVEVRYRGRAILFAGDLEAEGEAALVTAGLAAVDVVKVPHHGSPTSSTPDFVAATAPALAVISCGVANAFGFPASAVLGRWRAIGADVARTDRDGTITVVVDAAGTLAVDRFRSPPP